MHAHPAELGLINEGQKALVVAGHQHMVTGMVLGQLFEVVAQGAQQRSPPIGVVRLNQAHDLIVNDPTIRTIGVPVDAAQIDFQA
jgi:hypothetical protein